MISESLGTRLRQRRERRRIPLAVIAEQTKIKMSLLEGLERDDTSQWPSGIFRRAFIRAYASAIGLEPDEIVREFLEKHPDPEEFANPFAEPPVGSDKGEASIPASAAGALRQRVGAAVGSLFGRRASMETPPDRPATPSPESPVIALEAPEPSRPDLAAVAELCAELGRLDDTKQLPPLLAEAVTMLDAVGLIVWLWDPQAAELKPTVSHGYSDQVMAQLPKVCRDAGNATAAAFRSARACVVRGSQRTCGALAAPLVTPRGCIGVLGVELRHGGELVDSVRAVVTILAAQLARVVDSAQPASVVDRRLA